MKEPFKLRYISSEESLITGAVVDFLTTTLQVALAPSAVAVMIASPTLSAITFPSLSTVATVGAEEVHVAVAVLPYTVAVSCALSYSAHFLSGDLSTPKSTSLKAQQ